MTDFECWRIEDVCDETAITVFNLSKLSPTHQISNIHQQQQGIADFRLITGSAFDRVLSLNKNIKIENLINCRILNMKNEL